MNPAQLSPGTIDAAVARLGGAPLSESALREHVWPLFSKVLERSRREIYLCNHSLGRPPDRMSGDVAEALQAWYRDMGEAWDAWNAARDRWRALTARLLNAPRADCIVPKTSAGQGLRAVLNSFDGKVRVVATDGEFDSLDFILRVYRSRGRIDLALTPPDAQAVAEALIPGTGLVVISSVMFRSGSIVQGLGELVRRAHAAGAKVLADVYHGAGVVPTDLRGLDADFAVGGSYKYLRGGPGACWLYVRPDHLDNVRTLDTGWFAKQDAFSYRRPDPPRFAPGGDAWLESTPPVLGPFQALAGLELTLAIGIARLREYSLAQKRRLAALLEAQGVKCGGAGEAHGAFVTLTHPDAGRLAEELGRRAVNADARGDTLRLCPDILNSEEELAAAAQRLGEVLREAGGSLRQRA